MSITRVYRPEVHADAAKVVLDMVQLKHESTAGG